MGRNDETERQPGGEERRFQSQDSIYSGPKGVLTTTSSMSRHGWGG